MRHYDDGKLKTKHVRESLSAIENFHFSFTAVTSQRSSGGISFMYASAARELYAAASLQKRSDVLRDFKKKLSSRKPQYDEFEALFLELKYSSKFSKQKNLVRYILTRIYQFNSTGVVVDSDQMTIEHLAPESPSKGTALSDEDVASIGNLVLVDQKLNEKLANKKFSEKVAILKGVNVWLDNTVLNANTWDAGTIVGRAKRLAEDAYKNVWRL